MKSKKHNTLISQLAAILLLGSGGVAINLISMILPQSAQAAGEQVNTMQGCFLNVPFSGTIAFSPTNIRQEPTTTAPIPNNGAAKFVQQIGLVVPFSGIGKGQPVNDAWGAGPDDMWYRLADGRGWVASAVIKGYPPRCPVNTLWAHPLKSNAAVSQAPGGSTSHTGRSQYAIDYAVGLGTSVYAMREGTVVSLADGFPDTGGGAANINRANYVIIQHSDGLRSAYFHLQQNFNSRVGLRVGQQVSQRQLIGYSGNSGWSTGPHLHVEVHQGNWGPTVAFQPK
jgi:murein DD-endopeptidase MepM/ murein hydrolase activator NlpD